MEKFLSIPLKRRILIEAFQVVFVFGGLCNEHTLAIFQSEGVDVLVVLPKVFGCT
jgi:hypothetical protein